MKKLNNKSLIKNASLLITAAGLIVGTAALTGCYAFFQEKISMDSTQTSGTISDLFTPETKITELETPGQVFASQGLYPNKILVSWKEVPSATSYRIERATVSPDANGNYPTDAEVQDNSEFVSVTNFCYQTVYTDTILTNPSNNNEEYSNRYYYRVIAENIKEGLESTDFTKVSESATQGLGWLLKTPSEVEAWKGKSEDTIQINWKGVNEAAYYLIYRGEKENGSNMEQIAQVRGNQTSYSNTILTSEQGQEFYYKICAQTSNGQTSAFSSLAMGFSLKYGAPSAPENIKVSNPNAYSKTSLTVTWDRTSDAASGTTRTYSLYRTSSADSVYTLVKSGIPQDTLTWTEKTGLKTGLTYYYYMQTVDTNDSTGEVTKSSFSATGPESDSPAYGFLLSAPVTLEVEDSSEAGKVTLKWTPAVGTGTTGLTYSYNIYYSDTQDGTYNILDGSSHIAGTLGTDGYLAYDVEKKNFYKVSTINEDSPEVESNLTTAAAPVPDAPSNVTATKTANLSSLGDKWTPNANEVYPVKITWTKPSTTPVPAGYYVYRSTKPDAAFKKITDDPVTDTYYIDANDTAKSGVFYYYKVVSLNTLKQGRKGNNPADDDPENGGKRASWGYGALTLNQWFREYNKEIATSQAKLVLMHKSSDLDKVGSETIYAFLPVKGSTGSLGYTAAVAGLGAEITMPYKEYGDHAIVSNGKFIGISFILNGNTDTTSNMSANGNMHETVQCYHYDDYVFKSTDSYTFTDVNSKNGGSKTYTGEIYDYVNKTSYKAGTNGLSVFQGMYPGYAIYNNLEIKGGAAGGGYYLVQTYELDRTSSSTGTVIIPEGKVDWLIGEEIRN